MLCVYVCGGGRRQCVDDVVFERYCVKEVYIAGSD